MSSIRTKGRQPIPFLEASSASLYRSPTYTEVRPAGRRRTQRGGSNLSSSRQRKMKKTKEEKPIWTLGGNNAKLGEWVASWSISPKISCPGASDVCKEIVADGAGALKERCYGFRGRFAQKKLRRPWHYNFGFSKTSAFAATLIEAIKKSAPRAFRLNDVGDFYSPEYIAKCRAIVRALPHVACWAYTRSWRCPESWPALRQLASEPNMTLWLSLDRSMGQFSIPADANDLPIAWLAVDNDDKPPVAVNLIFRFDWKRLPPLNDPQHFGARICPHETGSNTKTSCIQCRYCIDWKRRSNKSSS